MRHFVGRQSYLKRLENQWQKRESRLLAIYGRRRVGKTELIHVFAKNKKAWHFEAIEGEETAVQVKHFLNQLSQWLEEPYIRDLDYHDWPPVFELLSQKIEKEKHLLLVFDELSWMAAGRTKLISYIKYFWDRSWKYHPHLIFILCGSVASWMVKNVVRSNALYGRISENILVEPLEPFEVAEFIGKKRGRREVLEYLLLFGGIPRYLEEFDFDQSIQINIENQCFQASGFFVEEADKIFYNQFKETQVYRQIVQKLMERPLNLKEIAKKINIPSGGGLKLYLDNLTFAGIIDKLPDIQDFKQGKTFRYYVVDEFLRFHNQFIRPHLIEIKQSKSANRFEKLTTGKWYPFLGYAFERFCLKHRYRIAERLGFASKVMACGPLLSKKSPGFQYDLIFLRRDGVLNLCEVKYLSEKPGTKLIPEMESRLSVTKVPKDWTIEKTLICNLEPSLALKESKYFHQILHVDEWID